MSTRGGGNVLAEDMRCGWDLGRLWCDGDWWGSLEGGTLPRALDSRRRRYARWIQGPVACFSAQSALRLGCLQGFQGSVSESRERDGCPFLSESQFEVNHDEWDI